MHEWRKRLELGNSTFRSALGSSAMLLARSFGSTSEPNQSKTICLTLDDRLTQLAHVLFNQDRESFVCLTVNRNDAHETLITQIGAILTDEKVDGLLVLSEKAQSEGEESLKETTATQLDLLSVLRARSRILNLKFDRNEIDLSLGLYDPTTGKVHFSEANELGVVCGND